MGNTRSAAGRTIATSFGHPRTGHQKKAQGGQMKYLVKIMFDALVHEDLSNVAIQVYSKDFDE